MEDHSPEVLAGDIHLTLNCIVDLASKIRKEDIRRVLLLYEEPITSVGDTCIRFNKLKYFRSFLNNAAITMNFRSKKSHDFCTAFFTNNSNIDIVTVLDWNDIAFDSYDIVFCMSNNERAFLEFMHEKYGALIIAGTFRLMVFSINNLIYDPHPGSNYVFPVYETLTDYVNIPRPGELAISEEEQIWADKWLESKGLMKYENLFIILDSTTRSSKLLTIKVYFGFLRSLLSAENVKVLIFDEKDMGKSSFYRECLGETLIRKIIFSNRSGLRSDLCLLGSRYVKLIFGPCTGLMHCASSIYNNYISRGMDRKDVPVMIVYTGRLGKENYNVDTWWGSSPLIDCLQLMQKNNQKEIIILRDLTQEEKDINISLPCTEYTPEMLVNFIRSRLKIN